MEVKEAVEVAVEVAVAVIVEAACEGRNMLTPRPRPKAESTAMTAPTAICLLS